MLKSKGKIIMPFIRRTDGCCIRNIFIYYQFCFYILEISKYKLDSLFNIQEFKVAQFLFKGYFSSILQAYFIINSSSFLAFFLAMIYFLQTLFFHFLLVLSHLLR